MIDIKSISGELLLSVSISPESVKREELMTADYVQLSWRAESGAALPMGAYIEYEGERYSLLEPYTPEMQNEASFRYAPQFQSRIMRWQKIIVPVYTYEGDGVTVKSRELDWTFTGAPADLMFMVQQAIRNEIGEQWNVTLGDGLPETITVAAQSSSIWSVLSELAEQCETEWWADKAANWLYLSKYAHGTALTLEVGKNIKTPSVTANKEGYYTRFYAFGSTRNITQDEGVVQGSIVNKRLTLDSAKYPHGYKDIKGHFENGVYVSDLLPEEVLVKSLYFDEIYPSSPLTISNVRRRMRYRTDNDGNRILIGGDKQNPVYEQYAIWYFRIPDFEFTEDLIIEGLTLSVAFKSGKLRGREFELAYHAEEAKVADNADVDKEFTVMAGEYEIIFDESSGFIIPDDDYIIPADRDEVVLFNINMPQEYVDSARVDLEAELDKAIAESLKDNNSYEFDSNPVAFFEDNTDVSLGRRVKFIRDGVELETRVMMVEKHLDYTCQQRIRVGNVRISGSRQQLRDEVRNIGEEVSRMGKVESQSGVILRDHTRELMLSMGRYYAMQDAVAMLQNAMEGFTGGISPVTVETMVALIGDESLQFRFTSSRDSLQKIDCPLVYDAATKQLNADPCALVHMTLGITSMTAMNVRKASDYKSWNMQEWHSEIFDDPTKAYYVYAKVEKDGSWGTYVYSEKPIAMNAEEGVYHFLVGTLAVERAGTRELVTLYGFTEILPSRISTDRLVSSDGSCVIDLANNTITGPMRFLAGTTGIENIEGLSDVIENSVGGLEFGKYNLLRNSGFTGDFVTESLEKNDVLTESLEMFSNPFAHWTRSNAIVIDSEVSQSGKECQISSNGYISQKLQVKVIKGENYVISFRAKGKDLQVITAGYSKTMELTSEWERYVIKFTALNDNSEFAIINADCNICEIQLERGNVVSAWGHSMWDNQSELAKYQSMQYLEAILKKGSTDINGGLIMSNLLLLGNPEANDNTAGVSGIRNDDNDVAFWGGGTYLQAIDTVMKYVEDPTYQPTDAEVASMAKAVITHGGRAILNDIILRGTIYTKKGMLGNLSITEDGIEVKTEQGGRVVINPSGIILYDSDGNISGSLGYCGGSAISAIGRGGLAACPNDDYHAGVHASSDRAAFVCTKGNFTGLRTVTKVISTTGGTDADNPRHRLTEMDYNALVSLTSGTCYLDVRSEYYDAEIEDGQEYIIESMGASLDILSGEDNIFVIASGSSYGSDTNPLLNTGKGVFRLKYYKDAHMWTFSKIA